MEGIQKMGAAFAKGELNDAAGMRRLLALQLFDESLISDETVNERVAVVQQQPVRAVDHAGAEHDVAPRRVAVPDPRLLGHERQVLPVLRRPDPARTTARNIRFVMLSECGHWVQVEHRELFNRQCLAFLQEARG